MKSFPVIPALILALAVPGGAQTPAPAAPAARPGAPAQPPPVPKQAEAVLVYEKGKFEKVWIVAASVASFAYRETEQAIDLIQKRRSEVVSIYFLELPAYKSAMDLYQGRRYAEARDRFAQIKTNLKGLQELPNNPSTLAGFYELECLRRLNDLEGLAKALEGFRKEGLTREHHLRQIDLYILWDAVRTKGWPRLDAICKEQRAEKLPGYQRAQIGYCHGLALEALGRSSEALNAYATAITADFGATEEITREAALNSLRILKNDPEVQLAIKLWGTPDENPNAQGRFRLQEAGALAAMYELTLSAGKPLPSEYKELIKYKSKEFGGSE